MPSPHAPKLGPEGLTFALRVIPKASRSAILPPDGEGVLVVRLQAPPVEGAANEALVALLAKALGVAKTRVRILQGEHARRKVLCVQPADGALLAKAEAWWALTP